VCRYPDRMVLESPSVYGVGNAEEPSVIFNFSSVPPHEPDPGSQPLRVSNRNPVDEHFRNKTRAGRRTRKFGTAMALYKHIRRMPDRRVPLVLRCGRTERSLHYDTCRTNQLSRPSESPLRADGCGSCVRCRCLGSYLHVADESPSCCNSASC